MIPLTKRKLRQKFAISGERTLELKQAKKQIMESRVIFIRQSREQDFCLSSLIIFLIYTAIRLSHHKRFKRASNFAIWSKPKFKTVCTCFSLSFSPLIHPIIFILSMEIVFREINFPKWCFLQCCVISASFSLETMQLIEESN
jgi:hypothetical protein